MRLVTRGDLDGLTCSVLITSVERIDAIELVHPQELTDGRFEVRDGDVLANLPYDPRCSMWFDHHELVDVNLRPAAAFHGRYGIAPSTARLVHDYYVEKRGPKVFERYGELLAGTDRLDSANLTLQDVLNPQRVILLGFTIDSRTGPRQLPRLLPLPRNGTEVDAARRGPESAAGRRAGRAHENGGREASGRRSSPAPASRRTSSSPTSGSSPEIPVGNRFLVYTLFPEATVSVRLQWGPRREVVMATVGHNIFERSSWSDIGLTMSPSAAAGTAGRAPVPCRPTTVTRRCGASSTS